MLLFATVLLSSCSFLGYEIKKIEPQATENISNISSGLTQDNVNISATQSWFVQDIIPELEELTHSKEESIYWNSLGDIVGYYYLNQNSASAPVEDNARGDIYSFLLFCHDFVEVDVWNTTQLLEFSGEETVQLYDYLKENNFPARDDVELQRFIALEGIASSEYDLIAYLEGKISQKQLLEVYQNLLQNMSIQDRWFHKLYVQAFIEKIQNTLNSNTCDRLVTTSWIQLP